MIADPLLHTRRALRILLALTLAGIFAPSVARAQSSAPFVLQDAAGDTLVQVNSEGSLTPLLGFRFADGTLQTTAASAAAAGWLLGGNAGTAPGTHFLGTSDATPFEIQVDGQRVMRFEPGSAPNVIGGHFGNLVNTGVIGATISGGGLPSSINRATSNFGTVGGGLDNWASGAIAIVAGGRSNVASGSTSTVGGGTSNTAAGTHSTVSGGASNAASTGWATVGGGAGNVADGLSTTVGGGQDNNASGSYATVAGGQNNIASGTHAAVAGGLANSAGGAWSFAAGRRGKANHDGSFVWADGRNADFASAGFNTFNVRAGGGFHFHHDLLTLSNPWPMRIYNPNTSFVAGMRVTNDGFFDVTNHAPASTGFARLNTSGSWTTVSDRRLKTDINPATGVLAGVMQLQPARFRYRDDASGAVHLGMIAQEVQAVFPEFVTEGEILTLDYAGLSSIALGAIREQQGQIDALREENADLRERLARLEVMLSGTR